jgi:hypothetical protein
MITDKNDAFRHNACKKLAQLAKVIFTMSAQARDRHGDLCCVEDQYDNAMLDLLDRHQENAEAVAKTLVLFRKGCVDSSCREWGTLYKQLKADLVNLAARQRARFVGLTTEAQQVALSVKSMQQAALQEAMRAISAADELIKELKSRSKPATAIKRLIRAKVQVILEKIEAFRSEAERHFEELRAGHLREVGKNRGSIIAFLRAELEKRRDVFMAIRSDLVKLGDEIGLLRQQYLALMNERNAIMKRHAQTRTQLVTDSRDSSRASKRQITQIQEQHKVELKKQNASLAELKRALQLARANHKAELERLRQEAHQLKRQRRKAADSHRNELQRKGSDSDLAEADTRRRFKLEVKKRKDFQLGVQKSICECQADTTRLFGVLKQGATQSLERERDRVASLRHKLELQGDYQEAALDDRKLEFVKRGNERLEVLESAVDAQRSAEQTSEKDQKHLLKQLKSEYQVVIDENAKVATTAGAKFAVEAEEIKRGNSARCENRKAELQAFLDRKCAERKKRLQEMSGNFQLDVDQKVAASASERAAKVADLRTELLSTASFLDQEKTHETQVDRAKGSIDFLDRRIQYLKDAHGKRVSALQAELSKIEKAKRQLERRKKTETLAIDEDYERRIQVEQVNLRNAMDNLAKLYDPDENERGCDIIEAFRKVRETQNQTTDLVFRKGRDLDLMKRSWRETCKDLKQRSTELASGAREHGTEARIDHLRADTDARIDAVHQHSIQRLATLHTEMEAESAQHTTVLANLQTEIGIESHDFETAAAQIRAENFRVCEDLEHQIGLIGQEFAASTDKIRHDHALATERMQARLSNARKICGHLGDGYSAAKAKQLAESRTELERRSETNAITNSQVFAQVREQSERLSGQITDLSKGACDAEFRVSEPQEGSGNPKVIEKSHVKMRMVNDRTQQCFDTFYQMVVNAPQAAPAPVTPTVEVQPPPSSPPPVTSRPSSAAKNSTSRTSRSARTSRRESSRFSNAIDVTKSRSRPHIMVSAHTG